MSSINRIRPIVSDNPLVRSYGVTRYLPKLSDDKHFGPERRARDIKPFTPELVCHRWLTAAVDAILDVPGVVKVILADYEFEVTIASAFDWVDCHDQIVVAIKRHVFARIEDVDVQEPRTMAPIEWPDITTRFWA